MVMSLLLAVVVGVHWCRVVLVGRQVALVGSVLTLLVIWWIEWRGGRVW